MSLVLVAGGLSLAAEGTAKGEGPSRVRRTGTDRNISGIQGERYSISGTQGQEITLRVTKDTNIVCTGGQGAKFSTSQEGAKEHQEIPPTPHMQEQANRASPRGRWSCRRKHRRSPARC